MPPREPLLHLSQRSLKRCNTRLQCLALFARLGNQPLGAVGEDPVGDTLLALLGREGIDTSRLAATVFAGEGTLPWDEEAFELWKKADRKSVV